MKKPPLGATVLYLQAIERPDKVMLDQGGRFKLPKSWEVWNAPRPIPGTIVKQGGVTWQGEFRHGVFYAGIDPKDPEADTWRRNNMGLDAWFIQYVTKKELEAWADNYYGEEMGVDWREMIEEGSATPDDLWRSFFAAHHAGWH